MDVDDRAQIAAPEAVLGHITIENDSVEELEHG
jgi:hypothetical protein